MSLTLGQKLKQAREALGIPVSEVAAQTRIAPLYIESIDNDDYRALPGGIFNRGFVKSYAKYVGIDEQEALADYATLLNETEGNDVEEVKTYKPQVLTDDSTTSSIVPTLIIAVVILGVMTGGILFLVRQFSKPAFPEEIKKTHSEDVNTAVDAEPPVEATSPSEPQMSTLKVEFKTLSEAVSLTAIVDGTASTSEVKPDSTKLFEPKTDLKLSYSRSKIQFVQLTLNGKPIMLPASSPNPNRPALIQFEINKDNLGQIWSSGSIQSESAASTSTLSNSTFTTGISPSNPSVNTKAKPAPEKPKSSVNANSAVLPKPANITMKPTNKATR